MCALWVATGKIYLQTENKDCPDFTVARQAGLNLSGVRTCQVVPYVGYRRT